MRAKNISDHLITFGEPIIDRDLMLYIVKGLGPRYTSFVSSFNVLPVRPTLGVFWNMLESHDRMFTMQSNYEPIMLFKHMSPLMEISLPVPMLPHLQKTSNNKKIIYKTNHREHVEVFINFYKTRELPTSHRLYLPKILNKIKIPSTISL